MIRVAIVLNRFDAGGIEAVVTNYYRYLNRSRVQLDFYYDESSTMPCYEELKSLGAGLYPMPAYTHPIAYHRAHYQAFKERGYHIVHAHVSCMSVFSLLAAKRAGVPVRICHDHTVTDFSEGLKALLKYILRPFNRPVATHFFACGENAARWMFGNRNYEQGNVTIMTNSLIPAKFAFNPASRAEVRRELGIPEDAFVVGHIGRFAADKNHDYLLKVFSEVLKVRPDARLLSIGDGELFDQVKAKAPANCIFTGTRYDVDRLYSAMDVFAFPSYVEGLPVVLVEAQCNGLPCICSDTVSRETDITGTSCYLSISDDPAKWVEPLLSARRFTPEIPEKWDVSRSARWLGDWYLTHNDYVSAYVRNADEGPACYYRIAQYVQPNWKINNAYSRLQYRRNFDMPSGLRRKAYQALLLAVTVFNRTRQLNYDLRHHPSCVIIQRELVPKILPSFLARKLEKQDRVIWDFDDDILCEGECSRREFSLLERKAEHILVTSSYLRNLVDEGFREKVLLLPTTCRPPEGEKTSRPDGKLRVLWLGSFSNLPNLDLVGKMPDGCELTVVCNKPYPGADFNIPWTREAADAALLSADVGIMPLLPDPYNFGKGGFKLIQYMSAGLPVIASPIGFNEEIVMPDFGFLTDDFASALIDLRDHPDKRLAMGRAARRAYDERFSVDRNLQTWKETLS